MVLSSRAENRLRSLPLPSRPTIASARRAAEHVLSGPRGYALFSRRRLEADWPGFVDALEDAQRELGPVYESYVHNISAKQHAMSLELAAFLLELCRRVEADSVIDLGSGFSSYVLRLYASESPSTTVKSVDSSPDWLDKSRHFVSDQGLAADDFVAWSDFDPQNEIDSYDVVLHDLGDMTLRSATLPQALVLARRGAYVVLDDVHKPGYRAYARQLVSASSAWSIDIRAVTRDAIGRYSLLIRRY
jgi:predicted O-methyltransferase YrrM